MPETLSPQSAEPNLPGSEPAQSTTSKRDTFNDLASGLFEPRATTAPEKRSEVPSTPDASTPEQERKDTPAAPQQVADVGTTTQPQPNLSPEETTRREEQSFKDKYYALEDERKRDKLEREAYTERERIGQMSRVEQEANQRFQSQVQPLEQQAHSLYAEAQDLDEKAKDALSGGDRELADYFIRKRDTMYSAMNAVSQTVMGQYDQFNNALNYHRQQVHTERLSQQEKQVERTLSKVGLTLEELKAADPKLNMADNFAVIEATASALKAKHSSEIKEAKESATRAEKEYKEKWRTDSPAARPDKPVSGGGRTSTNRGGPGSGTADIAEGLSLHRRK